MKAVATAVGTQSTTDFAIIAGVKTSAIATPSKTYKVTGVEGLATLEITGSKGTATTYKCNCFCRKISLKSLQASLKVMVKL